ncbi:MAG TPA: mechanosensitive ion channel family protein [Solirubrobacterales bacterium]|nr:mechanosensitive ion channel family protein [Solirubrobacterales bacterium]
MSLPLPSSALSLLAQVEVDPDQVSDSGISEVSGGEWVLAAGVFIASIVIAIVVRRVIERLVDRDSPRAIGRLAGRLTAFLIVVLGFFYALSSVDVAVGPLLGGLGILGIAIAFSLQDVLANFAAGVILQTKRPVRVGDQIVSNDFEGEVEDVDFRALKIRDFDGETVYIPNSMVLQNPITNWTRTPTRRTTLEIGVAYDTDLEAAQRVFVEAMENCEGVLSRPAPEAYVYEFGESSINFAVRFWHGAKILEMWKARDAAAQAAKRALDEAGITIPFPQRTLWFGPGNTKLEVEQSERPPGSLQ